MSLTPFYENNRNSKLIRDDAKLKHLSVSNVMRIAIIEKIEDEQDRENSERVLAENGYKSFLE